MTQGFEEPRDLRRALLPGAIAIFAFVVLTAVTGETECAVDGRCEFGVPFRWWSDGVDAALAFVFDLGLFLSLVPAALAVQRSRSKLALAWLVLVLASLTLFTIVNWGGKLSVRIFLQSI